MRKAIAAAAPRPALWAQVLLAASVAFAFVAAWLLGATL